MKGLVFKLQEDFCKERGYMSNIGYSEITVLDRSLLKTENYVDENNKEAVYCFYVLDCIVLTDSGKQFTQLEEEDFYDEISHGIYKVSDL